MFKYTPSNLFFANGLIRFTQPSALNDPAEARAEIVLSKYSREDYVNARLKAKKSGFSILSDEKLEAMFLRPFPSARFDEKSFPGLWPIKDQRLSESPIHTVEELDVANAKFAAERIMKIADENFGILSLTSSDGDHMWAYYADDHKGIQIQFNPNHSFFNRTSAEIEYSDEPFYISSNDGWLRIDGKPVRTAEIFDLNPDNVPTSIFLRKKSGWSQEKEIRLIKRLTNADQCIGDDINGYKIHLFSIPPEAVESITFGYKASDKFIKDTCRLIATNIIWRDLLVLQRFKDSQRQIKIRAIDF